METVLNQREITPVSTEELFSVEYVKEEVLARVEDRRVRMGNLAKCITLGRHEGRPSMLVLATTRGYRSFKGIIYMLDDKGITMVGDHFIPMHAIYSVDFSK